jgi:CTP synthase
MQWVQSEELEKENGLNLLRTAQGIVVPGGFGTRGTEGMIKSAQYARERKIPYLGLCLGMQVMVAEFARNILGMAKANSTEFDTETPYPVIDLLPEQKKVQNKGATMRLGNYPCRLVPGTLAAKAYNCETICERHRHRYEFNNRYRAALGEAGLIYSGLSPDGELVEICELAGHPWMLGCQFHPEFGSRPSRPHPLFRDFIGSAKDVLREGAQTPLALSL